MILARLHQVSKQWIADVLGKKIKETVENLLTPIPTSGNVSTPKKKEDTALEPCSSQQRKFVEKTLSQGPPSHDVIFYLVYFWNGTIISGTEWYMRFYFLCILIILCFKFA